VSLEEAILPWMGQAAQAVMDRSDHTINQ